MQRCLRHTDDKGPPVRRQAFQQKRGVADRRRLRPVSSCRDFIAVDGNGEPECAVRALSKNTRDAALAALQPPESAMARCVCKDGWWHGSKWRWAKSGPNTRESLSHSASLPGDGSQRSVEFLSPAALNESNPRTRGSMPVRCERAMTRIDVGPHIDVAGDISHHERASGRRQQIALLQGDIANSRSLCLLPDLHDAAD